MTAPAIALLAATAAACGPWLRARIFTHTVAYRQPRRRHCPPCGRILLPVGWRGLTAALPAGGGCPHCATPIGPAAGSVEVIAAAVTVVLALRAPSAWILAAWCWVGLLGVALAFIDGAVHRLPDPLTAAATAGALAALTAATTVGGGHPAALLRAILAAAALAAFYLILILLPATGMGPGDGKLAVPIGLCLGYLPTTAVITATLAANLFAAGYVLAKLATSRLGRRDAVAFGPFMLLGALAALLITR
jgi:leader peptidase (prepilin peptidase)/N-methyltransferase